VLATAAWRELHEERNGGPAPTLGVVAAALGSLLLIRGAWGGAETAAELVLRSVLSGQQHVFMMGMLAVLAAASLLRKLRLTPKLASAGLVAALGFELLIAATWFGRPTYFHKASFAAIAALPANGIMLAPLNGSYL